VSASAPDLNVTFEKRGREAVYPSRGGARDVDLASAALSCFPELALGKASVEDRLQMFPTRTLGVTLVLGWHLLAGGVGNLLHTCRMMSEPTSAACKCHKSQRAAQGTDQLRASDCCTERLVRAETPPAIRDSTRSPADDLFGPTLLPLTLAAIDETSFPTPAFAWHIAPPSHGPPVFLKIRTLLI
jgi:hypothetical protein